MIAVKLVVLVNRVQNIEHRTLGGPRGLVKWSVWWLVDTDEHNRSNPRGQPSLKEIPHNFLVIDRSFVNHVRRLRERLDVLISGYQAGPRVLYRIGGKSKTRVQHSYCFKGDNPVHGLDKFFNVLRFVMTVKVLVGKLYHLKVGNGLLHVVRDIDSRVCHFGV